MIDFKTFIYIQTKLVVLHNQLEKSNINFIEGRSKKQALLNIESWQGLASDEDNPWGAIMQVANQYYKEFK